MRRLALFFLALLLPAALAAQDQAAPSRQWSPRRAFTGVYVTNFEISYFVECDPVAGACDDWINHELRWLGGATGAIQASFDACIARWSGSRQRWALFAIRFEGRETLDRRPKVHLNDTERRLVIDAPPLLELVGLDEGTDRDMARYRRLPTQRCPA